MICVSIGRGRHQQMIAEHQRLTEEGIPLVELRLDYIRREVDLKRLIANRPGPVIISCRRESDGGQWRGTEEQRRTLLRSAIVEGVEYVDLEDDIAASIPRYGKTKRIISRHDFESTPKELEQLHARMSRLDADIVKIVTMANRPNDNLCMLRVIQKSTIPTIGCCMGEMGVCSRLLAGKAGAPFCYAAFSPERSLAPGQISYRMMRDIYAYDQINAETQVFGVVADPVGQSLGPVVHNAAFLHQGLNKVYIPFRVPPEHLDSFLDDCPELDVHGLSVTIPHKEAALRRCDRVDKAVQGIGAINTLLFEEGHIVGHNTDYRAAMNCIDMRLPTEERAKPLAGRVALVLGAGGAARAFIFGLLRRGADVVIAGRTLEKAERLAKALGARSIAWERRHSVKADVIVNATPVGMHPNVDETPFDMHSLRPNMLVFDTVYNPEQTLLYKQARERQCRVISGVEMFIAQAALQYRAFTGNDAPVEVMHDHFRRATGAARHEG
jgi:3-dehydroquinate dehydratase/shikimate dehydrogenase